MSEGNVRPADTAVSVFRQDARRGGSELGKNSLEQSLESRGEQHFQCCAVTHDIGVGRPILPYGGSKLDDGIDNRHVGKLRVRWSFGHAEVVGPS